MFSEVSVSHSVHRRSLSPPLDRDSTPPPCQTEIPLWTETPLRTEPLLWTEIPPPDRDPLWTETALELTSSGNQCSGRYTFLLEFILVFLQVLQ